MTSQKMKCGCSNETMRPSAVFRFAMGTRKCRSASDYTDLDQSSNQDIAAPTVRKSNPDRRKLSTERAKRPLRTFRPSVAVVYVRNRSGRRSNRNEWSFANCPSAVWLTSMISSKSRFCPRTPCRCKNDRFFFAFSSCASCCERRSRKDGWLASSHCLDRQNR